MRLRPRNCLFALIANLAATILVSAGCGPGAPAEAPPQPQGSSKPKPRAALKLPARVIPAQHGAAQLLGRIGDKNLYSVNGERWLVDAAGKTERERAPLGDRLEGVFPYAQAGLAAIGWNAQHAYSFADVLGAPKMTVETNTPFTHVRPGPGAALLFTLFSATAVDLSTGLERGRFFPEFPVRDAVFVDERRGAVATAVGGIGTTTDGGKTWVPVRHKASMSPTLDLVLEGGGLRLREIYTNRIAKVDIDHAEIDDWEEAHPAAPRTPTPIEAWISTFGNPIPSAVRNGIDAGAGTGVVAWGENVARVDLATGLFTETAAFAGTSGECRGAMAGTDAYFVCSANGKRGLAEQLWRARTDGKLEMEKMSGATFGGPGSADVSGSGQAASSSSRGAATSGGATARASRMAPSSRWSPRWCLIPRPWRRWPTGA